MSVMLPKDELTPIVSWVQKGADRPTYESTVKPTLDKRCMTCHDTQDDCNACHRQMNVLPAEHFRPGWVNRTEGGEHSTQAQYDLASCMSCHDTPSQEPTCVRCHGK